MHELEKEIYFKTSRSGGKGGQNVNKVESKVQLFFNINASAFLSEEQKQKIHQKLKNKINASGILILSEESDRSQLANKELALTKFYALLASSLKKEKARKKTKTPRAAKEKRINTKKKRAELKRNRGITE